MNQYSRQALVGSIGHSHISLAIADIDALTIENFALLDTDDFTNPIDAIARYLASTPSRPDLVGLAVDGVVERDVARMSRPAWSITSEDIKAATGASTVCFVQEIEAMARMLPTLSDDDVVALDANEIDPVAPKLLVVAGTGFSTASLVHSHGRWVTTTSLAGGLAFQARSGDEFNIEQAFAGQPHISLDAVFSGSGLEALYRGMTAARGEQDERLRASQITERAFLGESEVAMEAVELIATWLARAVSDLAALFDARGGVYLAGGLCASLVPVLATPRFEKAFREKGSLQPYLSSLPVMVIKLGADVALRGAAIALSANMAQP
ncbi:ROK family protein [Devosia psychrophila]|uniref:Glucokinase n=1 Tax=Devosia psychrophila TaxID=728005 RepID=A0A0F5PVX3_9HYPH|nr:glucokinase [Devosia psychrophila]KKC32778.1 hypothetical protein WH91_12180 [Devosia psychrophila]SFD22309.1 glucokinase [Devosia psychrophila]